MRWASSLLRICPSQKQNTMYPKTSELSSSASSPPAGWDWAPGGRQCRDCHLAAAGQGPAHKEVWLVVVGHWSVMTARHPASTFHQHPQQRFYRAPIPQPSALAPAVAASCAAAPPLNDPLRARRHAPQHAPPCRCRRAPPLPLPSLAQPHLYDRWAEVAGESCTGGKQRN